MATLWQIDEEIMACIDQETGEIIDGERLDALQMERKAKLENVALWVKNLEADAAAFKAEKQAFEAREKAAANKVKGLKEWLGKALQGAKFATEKCAVSFRKSEAVEIADEGTLRTWAVVNRPELLRIREPEIDKTEVKKALKAGEEIPGAAVAEKLNINIK